MKVVAPREKASRTSHSAMLHLPHTANADTMWAPHAFTPVWMTMLLMENMLI